MLADLRRWSQELGFARLGVAHIDLAHDEAHFLDWLRAGFNGEMAYMSRHGVKRSRPAELLPGTVSCISVRMDYWPEDAADAEAALADRTVAYVSRYALGRDYHKLMRTRLQKLCDRIASAVGPFGYRVFTDSAPVLEKALARNAGLGWIGKHTNLIDRDAGSYFFLGEIYLNLDLPADQTEHRALRHAAAPACPPAPRAPSSRPIGSTRGAAFPISPSSWPDRFRSNFAAPSATASTVATTASWSALGTSSRAPPPRRTSRCGTAWTIRSSRSCFPGARRNFWSAPQGSAIRRIGYERWLRNIAVALGNAPASPARHRALRERAQHPSPLVREHVHWALAQHRAGRRSRSSGSAPGGSMPLDDPHP